MVDCDHGEEKEGELENELTTLPHHGEEEEEVVDEDKDHHPHKMA